MASKENQEALNILKNKYLNICDGSDYLEICSQFNDCKKHNDKCDVKEEIDKCINTLQQAIDNEELYKKAFEMAVKVYDEGCREDYWLNLARKVLERVRKELENGK